LPFRWIKQALGHKTALCLWRQFAAIIKKLRWRKANSLRNLVNDLHLFLGHPMQTTIMAWRLGRCGCHSGRCT